MTNHWVSINCLMRHGGLFQPSHALLGDSNVIFPLGVSMLGIVGHYTLRNNSVGLGPFRE